MTNIYEVINKALILNKLGELGDHKLNYEIVVRPTNELYTSAAYDPDTFTIVASPTAANFQRVFYHEGAHAIFDLFYECQSNPYICGDTVRINEFHLAAKETATLIARLLNCSLPSAEISQKTHHEIFSHLKEDSNAGIFWLNEISRFDNNFDDFWDTSEYYPEDEMPFVNLFNYYSKLSGHKDTCINPTHLTFQYPSQYLFPLAQQRFYEISHSQEHNEQELSFLTQMSFLVYYFKYEYDFELIARAIEFAFADNESITQTLNPLFQFLEKDFSPQINKMYEDRIELVNAQIGTHFNVSEFQTVLNLLTEA